MDIDRPLAELAAAQIHPSDGVPNRSLAGSNDAKPSSSTGAQPRKTLPDTEGSKETQSINDPTNTISEENYPRTTHLPHQKRPGGTDAVGSQGKKVNLSTNYFGLSVKPDLELHRYSITVFPDAKGRKLAQMIKDALDLPEFDILRPGIVSDFAAFLLSPQLLPEDLLKVSVPYKKEIGAKDPNDAKPPNDAKKVSDAEDPSDAEEPCDSRKYNVRFGFIRTVEHFNATNIQQSSADQGTLPIVQDLDIVLGHHRKSWPDITMIGKRKAFQLENPAAEGMRLAKPPNIPLLAALRGFFSSVRLSTTGILVNVNVSHGTFYLRNDLQNLFPMLHAHPEVHATKIPGLLKGLRVELKHLKPKTIIRTISGYASPGQGNGYEAHPPRVLALGARPRNVEFFEYKSTKPVMGLKDKENAKKGLLAAHNLSKCHCNGSYISVYDYFKKSMLIFFSLSPLCLTFGRVPIASGF